MRTALAKQSVPGLSECYRISVVDDEEGVRTSMKYILKTWQGLRLDGLYCCGEEALLRLSHAPPDAVFMDVRLPDISGIECTRILKRRHPRLRVIMISGLQDAATIDRAVEVGCDAYLTKPFAPSQCLAMLRCVLAHRPPRSHICTADPQGFCPRDAGEAVTCPRFTAREVRILHLLAEGLQDKDLARRLGKSRLAVHKTLHQVYVKLGVHTRIEAINHWRACDGSCSKREPAAPE